MALYGAIETLHDTEQSGTYPSRNILRDRHLKVNYLMTSISFQFVPIVSKCSNFPFLVTWLTKFC